MIGTRGGNVEEGEGIKDQGKGEDEKMKKKCRERGSKKKEIKHIVVIVEEVEKKKLYSVKSFFPPLFSFSFF